MLTYQNIVQEYFMLHSVLSASEYQNIRVSFKNTLYCILYCLHRFIRISEYRSRILYVVFCIVCIRISFKNTLCCILYCLHRYIRISEYRSRIHYVVVCIVCIGILGYRSRIHYVLFCVVCIRISEYRSIERFFIHYVPLIDLIAILF